MSEKRITREDLLEVVKVQSFALGMLIQEKQDQDDKIRGAVEESVREHIESEAGQKLKDAQARIEELERELALERTRKEVAQRRFDETGTDLINAVRHVKEARARIEELERTLDAANAAMLWRNHQRAARPHRPATGGGATSDRPEGEGRNGRAVRQRTGA